MTQQRQSTSHPRPATRELEAAPTAPSAAADSQSATPPRTRQPHPDGGKLQAGFIGLLMSLWFLVALLLYALGWILHQLARGLMAASGLGAVPQPAPLRPSPPFDSRSVE